MKFLILLALTVTFNVFAQGGGDHIGSGQIVIPYFELDIPSAFMSPNPMSRKILIYGNGKVVKEVSKYSRNGGDPVTTYTQVGVISDMTVVNLCATALKDAELLNPFNPGCADDVGSSYKNSLSGKTFALRQCGQVKSVELPCAKKMVKILDSFNVLTK